MLSTGMQLLHSMLVFRVYMCTMQAKDVLQHVLDCAVTWTHLHQLLSSKYPEKMLLHGSFPCNLNCWTQNPWKINTMDEQHRLQWETGLRNQWNIIPQRSSWGPWLDAVHSIGFAWNVNWGECGSRLHLLGFPSGLQWPATREGVPCSLRNHVCFENHGTRPVHKHSGHTFVEDNLFRLISGFCWLGGHKNRW